MYGVNPLEGGGNKWPPPDDQKMFRYKYGGGKFRVKDKNDLYFKRFLAEECKQNEPEKQFVKWRYGWPRDSSAFKSVLKYKSPLNCPKMSTLAVCHDFLLRHFRCMNNSRVNEDWQYLRENLNMSTSCGYPWNSQGYNTKRKLFEEAPDRVITDYAHMKKLFSQGNSSDLFTLAAKKELRKVKKIESDDFRTFTAASWRNTALGIALFGEMTNKFYASYDTTWSFVGGSTFHGVWNSMMRRLSKHPNCFEGDFSNYDAVLHREWFVMLSDVFFSFLSLEDRTEENRALVTTYFESIVDTVIICPNGDIFQKFQGNPSGSSLTIVTNTMIHYALFVYAWVELGGPENYVFFHDNVEAALCGDDSLWTCSNVVRPWFHLDACAAIWNVLGVIMKPENTKAIPLHLSSFLSHQSIVLSSGYFMPVPDYEKVMSTMLFNSNSCRHVRWSYLKACALRIASWNHMKLRDLFSRYISWLLENFSLELRSVDLNQGTPTWLEVEQVYMTDSQLYGLYTLGESSAGKPKTLLKRPQFEWQLLPLVARLDSDKLLELKRLCYEYPQRKDERRKNPRGKKFRSRV